MTPWLSHISLVLHRAVESDKSIVILVDVDSELELELQPWFVSLSSTSDQLFLFQK